jgi:phage tail sheath gpL-like
MSGIAFDLLPQSNRIPGPYVEVDPSRALSQQPGELHRVLLIATKQTAGSAPADAPVEVSSASLADALFGASSMATDMVRAFKQLNTTARVFVMPVAESGGGVAATSTLTLAGTSTADGTLIVRVGDRRIPAAIPVGTTAAAAAALWAAEDANVVRRYTTSAVAGAVITFTAVHKGEAGNAVTIEAESLPPGLTATAAQPSNGATDPALTTPIANLDDTRYDTIVSGFNTPANLALITTEVARRWTPLVKKPGHAFAGIRGTHGQMVAQGNARNDPHLSLIPAGLSPTPHWIWAAQAAARDAQQTDALPNRPRNGLSLDGCEAPKPVDRLDPNERNALLYDGVSTVKFDAAGQAQIERLITTYQVNVSGVADATYLSIETVRNLGAYYLSLLALGSKYERSLIAPDGTNVSPGVPVMTPKALRGAIIAHYKNWIFAGGMKEMDLFKQDLLIELPSNDVERVNAQVVPRLVNGLVTLAFKLSFVLG